MEGQAEDRAWAGGARLRAGTQADREGIHGHAEGDQEDLEKGHGSRRAPENRFMVESSATHLAGA